MTKRIDNFKDAVEPWKIMHRFQAFVQVGISTARVQDSFTLSNQEVYRFYRGKESTIVIQKEHSADVTEIVFKVNELNEFDALYDFMVEKATKEGVELVRSEVIPHYPKGFSKAS